MSANVHPSCGHSVCSQCFIDTGDPRCVAHLGIEGTFHLDSMIVGTALAIRDALPHLTLSEALNYADASTVQGQAFRYRGGFFGLGYDRETLAYALAWYFTLWASDARNCVRGVRLGYNASLEKTEPEIKRAYGEIVRKRNRLLTGFERYSRRCKRAGRYCPPWPGTRNMQPKGSEAATIRAWLDSVGLTQACEAYTPEPLSIPEVHS